MEIRDPDGFNAWRSQTQVLTQDGREALLAHVTEVAVHRNRHRKYGNSVGIQQTTDTIHANHFIIKDFPDETHLWNKEQAIEIIIPVEAV